MNIELIANQIYPPCLETIINQGIEHDVDYNKDIRDQFRHFSMTLIHYLKSNAGENITVYEDDEIKEEISITLTRTQKTRL